MNKALYDWLDKVEGKKYSTYKFIKKLIKEKKAIKEMNKAFNPKGIKFEDAGEGWKRYKRKLKDIKEERKRK